MPKLELNMSELPDREKDAFITQLLNILLAACLKYADGNLTMTQAELNATENMTGDYKCNSDGSCSFLLGTNKES